MLTAILIHKRTRVNAHVQTHIFSCCVCVFTSLSCPVMSCHVLSCHVMSCLAVSCHFLAYPIITEIGFLSIRGSEHKGFL